MFEVGNIVMHPSSGVCQIEDIREEKFTDKKRLYYVLHPVDDYGRATIYVPVDSDKVHLRKLLTESEIEEVIRNASDEVVEWVTNPNMRKTAFSEILHCGNMSRIVALIVCLQKQKEKILADGKRYPVNDEKVLHDAERKIYQEFSHALSIEEHDIPEYIMDRMLVTN